MKLNEQNYEVIKSGTITEQSFSIAASAKAFDILSSKIYTDVPRAIVRELSTNAYDAQIEAGNPKVPFRVHLPNIAEPYFSIRDFGTGLSNEKIHSLYTTYFASNRNNSDEFVGCLGLGSKSPFAYTDQFTVISFMDGVARTYSCFKNEEGLPNIAKLGEVFAQEPNGLEVSVPVKVEDHESFEKAAQKVYRYFDVKPIPLREPEVPVFADINNSWALYKETKGIDIVMGQVCYRVNDTIFENHLGDHGKLIINMNVGDCSIAASREELHYDKRTVENIKQKLAEVFKEIKLLIEQRCDLIPTTLANIQARLQFEKLLVGSITRQRIEINPGRLEMCQLYVSSNRISTNTVSSIHPQLEYKYLFLEKDIALSNVAKAKLRVFSQDKNYDTKIYLCEIKDPVTFKKDFGEITCKLSELPKLDRSYGPRSKSSDIKSLVFNRTNNLRLSWDNTDPASVLLNQGCAVRRDGSYCYVGGQKLNPDEVKNLAMFLGYKTVYGIKSSSYSKLKRTLPELDVKCREYIESFLKNITPEQLSALLCPVNHEWSNFPPGVSVICDSLIKVANTKLPIVLINRLLQLYGLKLPATGINYMAAFNERYPLIVNMYSWTLSEKKDAILEYIRLIEASKS